MTGRELYEAWQDECALWLGWASRSGSEIRKVTPVPASDDWTDLTSQERTVWNNLARRASDAP